MKYLTFLVNYTVYGLEETKNQETQLWQFCGNDWEASKWLKERYCSVFALVSLAQNCHAEIINDYWPTNEMFDISCKLHCIWAWGNKKSMIAALTVLRKRLGIAKVIKRKILFSFCTRMTCAELSGWNNQQLLAHKWNIWYFL